MAEIRCPHCGTIHDTRRHSRQEVAGVVRCSGCGFVFVDPAKAALIIRQGAGGGEHGTDEPQTGISPAQPRASGPSSAGTPLLLLDAIAGPDKGQRWESRSSLVFIGRRNADVILTDDEVSRQHAVIEIHGSNPVLKDLGSTNGTFLDDAKIQEAPIESGAVIRIGDTKLRITVSPPQPSEPCQESS